MLDHERYRKMWLENAENAAAVALAKEQKKIDVAQKKLDAAAKKVEKARLDAEKKVEKERKVEEEKVEKVRRAEEKKKNKEAKEKKEKLEKERKKVEKERKEAEKDRKEAEKKKKREAKEKKEKAAKEDHLEYSKLVKQVREGNVAGKKGGKRKAEEWCQAQCGVEWSEWVRVFEGDDQSGPKAWYTWKDCEGCSGWYCPGKSCQQSRLQHQKHCKQQEAKNK